MIFKVLTLFPEVFEPYISTSIIGRSVKEKKIDISLINFRDFTEDKHHRVDDTTYGGGPGMVLKCEPLHKAIQSVYHNWSKLIFVSPNGQLFNQKTALRLAQEKEIILVCGHYEGFDQRIFNLFEHEIISIGDYVLTGGELPALVLIDCITRLNDHVLKNPDSIVEESFMDGLLEYDQYTKPPEYMGLTVPEILLSGHHKNIDRWRKESSLINTLKNRPDLIDKIELTEEDRKFLSSYIKELNNDHE